MVLYSHKKRNLTTAHKTYGFRAKFNGILICKPRQDIRLDYE